MENITIADPPEPYKHSLAMDPVIVLKVGQAKQERFPITPCPACHGREKLSRLLGLSEDQLFASGPMVALNVAAVPVPSTARPATPTDAHVPAKERS